MPLMLRAGRQRQHGPVRQGNPPEAARAPHRGCPSLRPRAVEGLHRKSRPRGSIVADSIRKKHWSLFKVPEKSGDIWQMRTFIRDHTGRIRKIRKSTGTADPEEADRVAGEIWVNESRRGGQPIPVEVAALAR